MNRLQRALKEILVALDGLGRKSALLGDLAVSVHAEPRFTRDVDLAVAVADDADAEGLVSQLRAQGYRVLTVVEQTATGRLATVRLGPPGEPDAGVPIDLLFASSGIDPEIVVAAQPVQVLEGVTASVIRRGHLIALKVFARDDVHRPIDASDLVALLRNGSPADLEDAREGLRLITRRGFSRTKDLLHDLELLVRSSGR